MNDRIANDLIRYAELVEDGALISPEEMNCASLMRIAAEALMSLQDGVQPAVAEQHKQEPVAWMDSDGFPWSKQGIECRTTKDTYTPLYTIPPRLKQEYAAHAVIAGALFDFMGWLTSREERIVLSSADEASPAVDAISNFAKMRGLSLDDAKVQDWNNTTPYVVTPRPQRKPLTDEQIEKLFKAMHGEPYPNDLYAFARAIEAKLKAKNERTEKNSV